MPTLTIPASVMKRKQACRSCRQRKKKCDAAHPACSLCRKWGIVCDYTTATLRNDGSTAQASAPEALSTTQPDKPLVLGLNLLERLPGLNFDLSMPDQVDYPSPDSLPYPNAAGDQQDMMADFQLPPHTLLVELVRLFFDRLYHMFPCFHRNSFEAQIEDCVLQKESPLILYALCCVAARYHPDVSVKRREKDWYAQAKFNYDMTQRDPYPGLRTIQAALVLILYAYTAGDFSAGWLFLGKAWRQAVALGMNRMDASNPAALGMNPIHSTTGTRTHYGIDGLECSTAAEKEEYRRTLWLMFIMDRNMAWPTAWPVTIPEPHFKVDIPSSDTMFQTMEPALEHGPCESVPFTRNLESLIKSSSGAKDPCNVFHYVCIAHVLLGRVSELVHSLHHTPDSLEYTKECAELDSYIVKFQLSLPRQAVSILEASPADRAHVVWLQVTLNTCAMLLHYRCLNGVTDIGTPGHFILAVTAARNIAQIIRDTSRISSELILSAHIGSSLYVAACILVIEWRMTGDDALREGIQLFELVFDRMNEVFIFLGMKFKFALEHDLRKSKEELQQLRDCGLRGLLADCTKWTHVKEEVQRRGILIDIT